MDKTSEDHTDGNITYGTGRRRHDRSGGNVPKGEPTRFCAEGEARFQAIFRSPLVGVAISDAAGRIVEANVTFHRMLGYDDGELVGRRFADITAPGDAEENLRLLDEVLAGKRDHYRMEKRYLRRDGTMLWADLAVFAARDAKGAYQNSFATIADITERKTAESALRESEEKYRDLFENAMDPIFVVDEGLRYVDVNRRAMELMGYSREELLGMSILDVVPPEQVPRSEDEFRKLRERGQYENFTGKMRTRDGRWLDIEVSSSAIIRDGRVVGSRDIVRDITERKRMEAEVAKAQKLESVGILAGGIAHDFNNLLVGILGNIELAKMDTRQDERIAGRLADAEKACLRAQDLTRQLLTFSRGGAPVKRTVVPGDIVRESARLALRGTSVDCRVRIADDLSPVDVDEGQLSQVMNNLIINAQQAMPGGGTIDLAAENVTLGMRELPPLRAGAYVKISVSDYGEGIPSAHLPKVFDPYFTTKQKGVGLGLATSYSIIRQHGGTITVESSPGAGATFSVYLAASSGAPDEQRRELGEGLAGKGRILVMDDEEAVRQVAAEMLRRLGYDVISVADGSEAVDRYRQARERGEAFDVVIMDLTVPGGMGGMEALRRLRVLDPSVKAVVSSGYSNDPVMAEYRAHGFNDVVSKPYRIRDLSETVARVIGLRARGAAGD